jgi:hypothetical protein
VSTPSARTLSTALSPPSSPASTFSSSANPARPNQASAVPLPRFLSSARASAFPGSLQPPTGWRPRSPGSSSA